MGRFGMAGTIKERIRNWMRKRFPPKENYIKIYECADVCELLLNDDPRYELVNREGMLFTARDLALPAPRKELVILTSVLASYSAERIIAILEKDVAPNLGARPQQRLLVDDQLTVWAWGESSIGGKAEEDPCETPTTLKHPV
jgi:hypothetical protein